MNPTLFDAELTSSHQEKDIVLSIKKINKPLSKAQQKFNRLTKRINKLQLDLENERKALDKGLIYYAKEIHPLEQELVCIRKETVRSLFKYYTAHKVVSNNNRKLLKRIIINHLDKILSLIEEPEADIREIFRVVKGITFEQSVEKDFDDMREEMETMFGDMGLDVNLQDFKPNMSAETESERFRELANDIKKQMEQEVQHKKARKKTARQLEQEVKEQQQEDILKRSVNTIYKQLAKLLHPDLEQDEERKKEKHALMQELTAAYKAYDLPTLLRLEMKWIHGENSNLDILSGEKLKVYNEVLSQQAGQLEFEKNVLRHHPRYYQFERLGYGDNSLHDIAFFLKQEKRILSHDLKSLKISAERLNAREGKEELMAIIQSFKNEQEQDEDLDWIAQLFLMGNK